MATEEGGSSDRAASGEGVVVLVAVDGALVNGAKGQGVVALTTQNGAREEVCGSTGSANAVVVGVRITKLLVMEAPAVKETVSAPWPPLRVPLVRFAVTPTVSAPC